MTLTRFAPAEHATPGEIQGQARYFLDMPPPPRYLLDIVPDVPMVLNQPPRRKPGPRSGRCFRSGNFAARVHLEKLGARIGAPL